MLSSRSGGRGFTIFELAISLIIVSIVATVISINWPRFTINLNAQAESLVSDIRYTQNLAMTKGERYRLVKTSPNSYQIINSADVAVIMPSGSSMVTLGNKISFGNFASLPQNLIAFDGKGIPYVDTTIPSTPLKEIATIALMADGNTVIVTIYPETGSVTTS